MRLAGKEIRTDAALRTWRGGLDALGACKSAAVADVIKARIHDNIAMTFLHKGWLLPSSLSSITANAMKVSEEDLTIASDNASTALKLCDRIIESAHPPEWRMLSKSTSIVSAILSEPASRVPRRGMIISQRYTLVHPW